MNKRLLVFAKPTLWLALLLGGVQPRPARADATLVFNEIMYHPATNEPALEWVECYNQLAVDLDISGWTVGGDIAYTFPEGSRAPGQRHLVLAVNPSALMAATGLANVLGPWTGRLSNSGGALELRNRDGRLTDRVQFGTEGDWPVAPDGAGVSLAKRDGDLASEPAANWAASEQIGGTPSADNFPPSGEVSPTAWVSFNELSAATDATFWVELVNEGTNRVALDGWLIRLQGVTDADYVFPPGAALNPGAYLSLSDSTLGFRPAAGDKLFLFTQDRARVVDAVVVGRSLRGRYPDGSGRWWFPAEPTPGLPNHFLLHDEVLINEIMYHHALLPPSDNLPARASPEQWIELYNRSSNTVDLSGWEIDGGVRYRFQPGQELAAGDYLVVARDAAALRLLYPSVDIVGDFNGQLSRRTDWIVLKDPAGNPADEVRYFDDGHWHGYADGGGSSLELRDPLADNTKAEAWAASDESGKSSWQTYSYRAIAGYPGGTQPTRWNDFVFGLLGAGECLIDDLSVVESPDGNPVPIIANGDFENGLVGWRVIGTHRRSRVIAEPGNPGNHVLHLVATGPQEHMHNHVETTLRAGRQVVNGREYQISFRARWLAGNNRLNTRLYFNRVARTTRLTMPTLTGSPGARNSRFATNLGPTFSGFRHTPVVPDPGEPVTVSVLAVDPQGVTAGSVWWSVNGGAWSSAPLTLQADGRRTGTIPGQPTGTVVQFYVEAADGLGAVATYPPAGPDSGALFAVADGQAAFRRGHNLRLLLPPAQRDLLHAFTNVMSNDELPCTVVYDERRAYYDVGLRLKGSQRGRYSDTRVSFHLSFQPDDLFRGVHPVMLIDRSGAGDSTNNKQLEILIKHILTRAGGIPGPYADLCRVIAPHRRHTSSAILSPRHEDEFIETAFENGGDGTLYELELIYYPTTADPAGYKNPQPDQVLGVDLQDLGDDQEFYRYNFMIKNHRDADDYRRFIRFAKTLSLTGATLEQPSRLVMDVEAWLRAWALVSLCGVGDSYTFGNDHNLLMYLRPSDGRFVAFPVDMDFSFVRGATSPLVGDRNLSRLINLPANLRLFYAHVLDLIEAAFNPGYMSAWIPHYNQFVPEQSFAWVSEYIRQRGNHAVGVIAAAGGNTPFALSSPISLTTPTNLVTLRGTAPVSVRHLEVNGVTWPVTWSSLTQWTVQVPVDAPTNVLVLQGIDVRGRAVPNATATVTVNYTGAAEALADQVIFNEIMYNPAVPDAAYLELFNASADFAFDLSGWRIDGVDFAFPTGSFIGPGQYLLLAGDLSGFAAAYPPTTPAPWAAFPGNLCNDGETLTLLRPGPGPGEEDLVDRVRYESGPPWPTAANGFGPSLQLIDPAQDNSRVANWAAVETGTPPVLQWVRVVAHGTASSSTLYIYLQSAGDLYLDDIALVAGDVPEVGPNAIQNGDFESALSGPWVVSANQAASSLSASIKRTGTGSLHLVASSGGSSRSTAIYQDLSPALAQGRPYTLSFWYRQNTNGGPLTIRLSGSGLVAVVDPAPPVTGPYTPGLPNSVQRAVTPFPSLWLNEVQPDNRSGAPDNFGEREAWIELFNAGASDVSLGGLFLSDNYADLVRWAFPAGTVLGAGQFLLVWADGEPGESTGAHLHTSFRLGNTAGALALSRLVEGLPEIIDYVNYGTVAADQSYGSLPDGQGFVRWPLTTPTPSRANAAALPGPPLFINEWMAGNTRASGITDPADGQAQDWFELYNAGDAPVDLEGWHLSDTPTNPLKYRIPAGYTVPPHGYLLVWADEETGQNAADRPDLHVNFKLNRDGEAIRLSNREGALIDAVTYRTQTNNVSQGRSPDGAVRLCFMPRPTPRAANEPCPQPIPPEFATVEVSPDNTVSLTVHTVAGQLYRVEFKEDLNDAEWTPLASAQAADGSSLTVLDPAGPRAQRFYRVVWLP